MYCILFSKFTYNRLNSHLSSHHKWNNFPTSRGFKNMQMLKWHLRYGILYTISWEHRMSAFLEVLLLATASFAIVRYNRNHFRIKSDRQMKAMIHPTSPVFHKTYRLNYNSVFQYILTTLFKIYYRDSLLRIKSDVELKMVYCRWWIVTRCDCVRIVYDKNNTQLLLILGLI